MRDYSNMPVLDWQDRASAKKAEFQILHQEPVILQMPDGFDGELSADQIGCELQPETGVIYNCNGSDALNLLADKNHLPELDVLATACKESSSQVDVDPVNRRIIVHD